MSLCDLAPGYIRAIAPYQPGKPTSELARELGLEESGIVKLASNENPLGVSPKALAAMRSMLDGLARYPDGNGFELKQALSQRLGVEQNQIVLGNGSNDVLELAARAFLAPGLSAVYAQHAFAVYPLAVQAVGAQGMEVPAQDFGHDLPAMAAAVRADTRIVFVANPNNPTGTFVPGAELEKFVAALPRGVLVVLDEAYTEYLSDADRYNAFEWVAEFSNLLVSRSFSKAYGLAGLRVGFGVAQPEVTDLLNRIRQPFNVNALAQAAAGAALFDQEFLAKSQALNAQGLDQLAKAVTSLGLEFIPSWGNFLLIHMGNVNDSGMRVFKALLAKGVITRPVANYDLPQWLRVSVGTREENDRFISALGEVL